MGKQTCTNCTLESEEIVGDVCKPCMNDYYVISNKDRTKFIVMSRMYYYAHKLDKIDRLRRVYTGVKEACINACEVFKQGQVLM